MYSEEDLFEFSDRECEEQALYQYPVDSPHYQNALANSATYKQNIASGRITDVLYLPAVMLTKDLTGHEPEFIDDAVDLQLAGESWALHSDRLKRVVCPLWLEQVVRLPLDFRPNDMMADVLHKEFVSRSSFREAFSALWRGSYEELSCIENPYLREWTLKEMDNAMVLQGVPTLHTGFPQYPILNDEASELKKECFGDRDLIEAIAAYLRKIGATRKQKLTLQRTTSPGLVFQVRRSTMYWKFMRNLIGAYTIAKRKLDAAWYYRVQRVMNMVFLSRGFSPLSDVMLQGCRHQCRRKPSPIQTANCVDPSDIKVLAWERYVQGKNRPIHMINIFTKTHHKYAAGITSAITHESNVWATVPEKRDVNTAKITQLAENAGMRLDTGETPCASDLEAYDTNQSWEMYQFYWRVLDATIGDVRNKEHAGAVAQCPVIFAPTWGRKTAIYAFHQAGGFETSGQVHVTPKNCVINFSARVWSIKKAYEDVLGIKYSYEDIINRFDKHIDDWYIEILGDDHAEFFSSNMELVLYADKLMNSLGLKRGYEKVVTFLKLQAYSISGKKNFITGRENTAGPNIGSYNKNVFSERPKKDWCVILAGIASKSAMIDFSKYPRTKELWNHILSKSPVKRVDDLPAAWSDIQSMLVEYAKSAASNAAELNDLYNRMLIVDGYTEEELEEVFGSLTFDPEEEASNNGIGDLSEKQMLVLSAALQAWILDNDGECPSQNLVESMIAGVREGSASIKDLLGDIYSLASCSTPVGDVDAEYEQYLANTLFEKASNVYPYDF